MQETGIIEMPGKPVLQVGDLLYMGGPTITKIVEDETSTIYFFQKVA